MPFLTEYAAVLLFVTAEVQPGNPDEIDVIVIPVLPVFVMAEVVNDPVLPLNANDGEVNPLAVVAPVRLYVTV